MDARFRQRLLNRDLLLGTVLSLPSPELAEICAGAGLDWLFVDMEHGQIDPLALQRIAQATQGKCACLARLPVNDDIWFKKTLDVGIAGVIVPLVNTAEEAQKAVHSSKYPPFGTRSVGLARAHAYGPGFKDYVDQANASTTLIVQIEHIRAVENVEAIISVPGVDGVLVGPFDLSASLGLPGQVEEPRVVEAIEHVAQVCQAKGVALSIFAGSLEFARRWMARGFHMLAVSSDVLLFGQALQEMLVNLRK
jgi:2-dehydro-3-deoxyglucarate aldolase